MRRCIIKMRAQRAASLFQVGSKPIFKKVGDFTVTDRLLELAARGNPATQYRLACCYADGFGVEQNAVTACKWFQSSVAGGYVPAMFRLGDAYLNGDGVDQSRVSGLHWLLKAANLGNRDAAARLGSCYLNGRGLPKRTDLAVKWLRIAANRGCIFSMLDLGFCYRDGIGLEQDLVKACVCLNVLEARSKYGQTTELNMQWTAELTDAQLHEMRRLSDKMIHGGLPDL